MPLARPKKAAGQDHGWHFSQRFACVTSGAEGVEHHRVMKPSSQDQNPSRTETGLDASDNIHVFAEGRGRICFTAILSISKGGKNGGFTRIDDLIFCDRALGQTIEASIPLLEPAGPIHTATFCSARSIAVRRC